MNTDILNLLKKRCLDWAKIQESTVSISSEKCHSVVNTGVASAGVSIFFPFSFLSRSLTASFSSSMQLIFCRGHMTLIYKQGHIIPSGDVTYCF